jgi:preprotein translocase subunit SecY
VELWAGVAVVVGVAQVINNFLKPENWAYGVLYFILVFAFTYFYTTITFDPKAISENLQKISKKQKNFDIIKYKYLNLHNFFKTKSQDAI